MSKLFWGWEGVERTLKTDSKLSVTWMTVASHSWRRVEFMMLSMAKFNTSMPATSKRTHAVSEDEGARTGHVV